ncbi:MAG: hypothetical protein OXC40_07930 [Proteobacteria bacterium]|nr:hypothetical protein [Pseudomonadota bacterium]
MVTSHRDNSYWNNGDKYDTMPRDQRGETKPPNVYDPSGADLQMLMNVVVVFVVA